MKVDFSENRIQSRRWNRVRVAVINHKTVFINQSKENKDANTHQEH